MRADGMTNDEVENMIKETEPRATRVASVVRRRIDKVGSEVMIINNISKIINKGVNLEDLINKCTGDNHVLTYDVSDKPIVIEY
ncbi:Uncharacterized protein TCM_024677 [Theobroma cacao]|uniref:Uncharacterized protein n=1 Tax=Theobroma cacao TaxID=3641 RepID=A0A061EW15_THECC|nr:Uncharacterized protein TCM_024677 [Theobroma cacao]